LCICKVYEILSSCRVMLD